MNGKCNLILLLLILLLLISSCKQDSTGPGVNGGALTSISGKVNNWTLGDTMTAIASRLLNPYGHGDTLFIFGSGLITNDGNFSFTLSSPPSEILTQFTTGIAPSDTNARRLVLGWIGIMLPNGTFFSKVLDNSNKPHPSDLVIGDYYASFHYVDRDVDMVGSTKFWIGPTVMDSMMIQYNLHYKKGWNRIVNTVIFDAPYLTVHEQTVENINAGNWYLDN